MPAHVFGAGVRMVEYYVLVLPPLPPRASASVHRRGFRLYDPRVQRRGVDVVEDGHP